MIKEFYEASAVPAPSSMKKLLALRENNSGLGCCDCRRATVGSPWDRERSPQCFARDSFLELEGMSLSASEIAPISNAAGPIAVTLRIDGILIACLPTEIVTTVKRGVRDGDLAEKLVAEAGNANGLLKGKPQMRAS